VKRYDGRREEDSVLVTVNGRPLNPRFDLRNHSPTGFEWGYGGSGPAQLALAILADCVGDELALQHYQEFKRAVIESLPRRHWTLTSGQIEEALKTLGAPLPLSPSVPSNRHHIEKGCNETR
jgi:hypothetical protein